MLPTLQVCARVYLLKLIHKRQSEKKNLRLYAIISSKLEKVIHTKRESVQRNLDSAQLFTRSKFEPLHMGSGVEIHGAYQQFQLRKLFLRSVGHRSRFHFCNPNKTKYRAGQKCTPNTDIIDICFYHWQKPLLLISVLGVNFRPTLYY